MKLPGEIWAVSSLPHNLIGCFAIISFAAKVFFLYILYCYCFFKVAAHNKVSFRISVPAVPATSTDCSDWRAGSTWSGDLIFWFWIQSPERGWGNFCVVTECISHTEGCPILLFSPFSSFLPLHCVCIILTLTDSLCFPFLIQLHHFISFLWDPTLWLKSLWTSDIFTFVNINRFLYHIFSCKSYRRKC